MARNVVSAYPKWMHYFDTLNSTNNYAMQLVDDGLAQHGDVVWAKHQTQGKGQRGKSWQDDPGNLKCSLIIKPEIKAGHQFMLSMAVSVTIAHYLRTILPDDCSIAIKWPNDIYINDKKACGILIENSFRGMEWGFAIVGIGLNVHQTVFPEALSAATSLKDVSGRDFALVDLIQDLRSGVLNMLRDMTGGRLPDLPGRYNELLFRKDKSVQFRETVSGKLFEAYVSEVEPDGQLVLLTPTGIKKYTFGGLEWQL